MEFVVGKTTYMSVEEADSIITDEFFEDDPEAILWSTYTELDKQRVILKGTRLVDNLPFLGRQYPGYQSMKWPRLIQWQYVDCPYEVKVGILKQVLKDNINNNKDEHKLQELGVKSYSIKGASITFTDNVTQSKLSNGIYDDIFAIYFSKWVY